MRRSGEGKTREGEREKKNKKGSSKKKKKKKKNILTLDSSASLRSASIASRRDLMSALDVST